MVMIYYDGIGDDVPRVNDSRQTVAKYSHNSRRHVPLSRRNRKKKIREKYLH